MSIIIPANTLAAGGFDVDNSVRFNDGDSAYMHKTAAAGNRRTFTFSTWFKRGQLGTNQQLFNSYSAANAGGFAYMQLEAIESGVVGDRISLEVYGTILLKTTQVLRDPSSWYHLVIAVDTTSGTANNRCRMYLNGTEITDFVTRNNPDQNFDFAFNQNNIDMYLGSNNYGGNKGNYFDGYMAEVVWIDGTQYAASDFGEFDEDSNIWKPIDVSGLTAGTNGFYLDFKASANLGNDAFGGTDLDEYNLTAIDQSTDTCTNNFATLNPLAPMDTGSLVQALSEGNLKANGPAEGVGWQTAYATIPLSSGKWYIEVLVTQVAGNEVVIGLNPDNFSNTSDTAHSNSTAGVWYQSNGNKWVSGSSSSYGATYDDGDIISVLINMDDSEVTFYKNDASQGTISFNTNLTGASSIIFGTNGIEVTSITQFNFGSPPYAVSSSNTDGNGYGNFEFATKGGYALNTKNLAEYG